MKAFLAVILLAAGLLCPCAPAQQSDAPNSNNDAFDSPEARAAHLAVFEALRHSALRSVGVTSASPDWNTALKCTKALIAKYPEFALGYDDLGIVYENMGFMDEAISAFQQEIKLDPTDFDPWHKLAHIYQDQGKITQANYAWSQAITLCQKKIESAPAEELKFRPLLELGDIYCDAGRLDDAIRAYQSVTREHGQELKAVMAWQRLAHIYADQGVVEKAVEAMHNSMHDKRFSEAWVVVAGFFVDTKEKKGNDELFEKCWRMAEQLEAQGK